MVGGLFNPATMTAGVYSYTVAGTNPCPADAASVTVTVVDAPDAGTPGTITLCNTDAAISGFSLGSTRSSGISVRLFVLHPIGSRWRSIAARTRRPVAAPPKPKDHRCACRSGAEASQDLPQEPRFQRIFGPKTLVGFPWAGLC